MRVLILIVWLIGSATSAHAADLSRIVVGFPAGQTTDIVARLIAERLGPELQENVIVENRPGQGGSIALGALARAAPDGSTLVLAPLASLAVNPHLYKTVGYDSLTDFAPVALVVDLPMLMVANPSRRLTSLPDLIARAKANPGKITFPSSGSGTLSHLSMETLKKLSGTSMLHVPYRGSVPALTDLIAGMVDVAIDTVTVTEPFIRDRQLTLLAVATDKRLAAFPDTPTIAELGYPGFSFAPWLMVVAPAKTPPERIARLGAAITKVMNAPDIVERLNKIGVRTFVDAPKDLPGFLRGEHERWGAIVKDSGLRVE
ncbi:Bug family tripartite tricarboxylate transporter substrate binding protein [Enterovirga rhinocerotis]|uniref:Tripartite-type tricarboxylate transporter receptor subunit TctC n=1 Tax=Enterovirga rhinocerotis TaxID=1339210 RepID=A0A4R7C9D4_9HYPH|nr:tripartite tricarboxylate transporter substrate binding protein [Enterovirga rhinocerotis]TDR93955.1 tripartite-type tricarboxylate transporter receptor subunit TctC [Enterovirga rhinocerotis]